MCGITGWFSPDPNETRDVAGLERMVRSLDHRGPDGSGKLIKPHAALGHTRLAIIDPQAGQQPMSYLGRYHIVFNGVIYNYRELRDDLLKRGYSFSTHSDTEVIPALYDAYGLDAFSKLRGMFAIALWDSAHKKALLVRDSVGIKPLFFRFTENHEMEFASEAKAILARQEERAVLNIEALNLLMNFRYVQDSQSLFAGIHQVKPGTVMIWSIHSDPVVRTFSGPVTSNSDNTLESLQDAVNCHLESDVPVSAYLSGGIDSATICALASRSSSKAIETYTLDIGDDPNEASNAARSASLLGLSNTQLQWKPESSDLRNLVYHLEAPKINSFQVFQLTREVSKHKKVVLSGLGGDELFYGYNAHRIIRELARASRVLPQRLTEMLGAGAAGLAAVSSRADWSESERAMRMLQNVGSWSTVYGILRNVWDSTDMRRKIYGPRMFDENPINAFEHLESAWPKNKDPLSAMLQFEWDNKLVNDLLWQEDRCSMAFGLEVRVPFLDTCFVNHALTIRAKRDMSRMSLKSYFKDAVSTLLPAEIIDRKKSGFQVDAPTFFNTYLGAMADEYLDSTRIARTGLFNPTFINDVRKLPMEKKYRWHYFILYLMICAEILVERFEHKS